MGRRAGAGRPRGPRSAPSRARGAPGGVHGGLRNETSVNETGLVRRQCRFGDRCLDRRDEDSRGSSRYPRIDYEWLRRQLPVGSCDDCHSLLGLGRPSGASARWPVGLACPGSGRRSHGSLAAAPGDALVHRRRRRWLARYRPVSGRDRTRFESLVARSGQQKIRDPRKSSAPGILVRAGRPRSRRN